MERSLSVESLCSFARPSTNSRKSWCVHRNSVRRKSGGGVGHFSALSPLVSQRESSNEHPRFVGCVIREICLAWHLKNVTFQTEKANEQG
jgi:hypothetical protein